MTYKRTVGFWTLTIFGILILIMLLTGQMISFIDYEFTVSLGLQESVNDIGEMGVAINKAFGVGDTIVYLPLLLMGLTGLWQQKKWGLFAMTSALGITIYWPIVNIFIIIFGEGSPGFNYPNFTSIAIILIVIAIYGIWGLWYLYKNRTLLIKTQKE
jgi:hypothetical protein